MNTIKWNQFWCQDSRQEISIPPIGTKEYPVFALGRGEINDKEIIIHDLDFRRFNSVLLNLKYLKSVNLNVYYYRTASFFDCEFLYDIPPNILRNIKIERVRKLKNIPTSKYPFRASIKFISL